MRILTMGEFAKAIGKSSGTLRNWEKSGKLMPHHKTEGENVAKKKKDIDYACMKVRCKDNNFIPYLYKKMKATKHFENILMLVEQKI